MFRITAENSADRFLLKLEGRLSGAWVEELEICWRAAAKTQDGRLIWVDLSDVDAVDAAGRYLLALMHDAGVRFIAKNCLMSELVREITGLSRVAQLPRG